MKNKHETKLKDISTKGFSRSNFIAVFIDEIVNGIVIFLGALLIGLVYLLISLSDKMLVVLFITMLVSVIILFIYRFFRSVFSKIRAYCRCNKFPLTKEELAELEIKSFQEYANFIHKMATYYTPHGKAVIRLSICWINEMEKTSYALFPEETLLESYFYWVFMGGNYEWDAYIKWCEKEKWDSYAEWIKRKAQERMKENKMNCSIQQKS